jgi:hypothetical protein
LLDFTLFSKSKRRILRKVEGSRKTHITPSLSLVEVIKVHLQLVKTDLATSATNAMEHAEHAGEHLDADTIKEITEKNERLGSSLLL